MPEQLQLPDQFVHDGEIETVTQEELERERQEARRKAQLDYSTEMKVAEFIGQIHGYEEMLNRPETPRSELAYLSNQELFRLYN